MQVHSKLFCALLSVLMFTAVQTAHAQADQPSPAQIAQACVQSVTMRANHRAQRNASVATNCSAAVTELLSNGNDDQAAVVAGRCIHRINHRSQRVAMRIQHRCQVCTTVLSMLGAPELAEMVQSACEEAIQTVAQSRQAAVAAIQDALGTE